PALANGAGVWEISERSMVGPWAPSTQPKSIHVRIRPAYSVQEFEPLVTARFATIFSAAIRAASRSALVILGAMVSTAAVTPAPPSVDGSRIAASTAAMAAAVSMRRPSDPRTVGETVVGRIPRA